MTVLNLSCHQGNYYNYLTTNTGTDTVSKTQKDSLIKAFYLNNTDLRKVV